MPVVKLSGSAKELVMEWVGALESAFTIEDMAQQFSVHEQTARRWVWQLKDECLLVESPIKRGRRSQFLQAREITSNGMYDEMAAAIKAARGNSQVTIAEWARDTAGNDNLSKAALAMVYLYVRSYYSESPDHQHLRGTIPPVEVRAYVASLLSDLRKDVEVLEQLVAYNTPWTEGGEISRRFGLVENLAGAMQWAEQIEPVIAAWKASEKAG